MPTIQEQVAAGAEAFADYENAIIDFKNFDMRGLLETLFRQRKIGFLEYQSRSAAFEAMLSSHEAETYAMHAELTKRAQALGVDLPQPRGGGDR